MICQNCNKNEANMHMKRILNGKAAEVHLCTDCARALGYGEAFSDFGFGLGSAFFDVLSASKGEGSGSAISCPGCGKTFDEIASDGKMGCAECYNVFYDKLKPSINKIHGKASYAGSRPLKKENKDNEYIDELKTALDYAVADQNYELAARLRDKINEVLKEGGASL